MTVAEPPSALTINSAESFMQNIMRFARAQDITAAEISRISGITPTRLLQKGLERTPIPHITIEKAKSLIERITSDVNIQEKLRQLDGYPQPSIDEYLSDLIAKHPGDVELNTFADVKFGEIFHFNREHRPVNDRYLRIADCTIPKTDKSRFQGVGTMLLSRVERDFATVSVTQAFSLIEKLGYSPNAEGLETFCRDTAKIRATFLRRQERFAPALFIHMYRDGIMRQGPVDSDLNQRELGELLKIASSRVKDLVYGRAAPTDREMATILSYFDCVPNDPNETELQQGEIRFYEEGKQRIANLGKGFTLPQLTPPSEQMALLGERIKAIREELGLKQVVLYAHVAELPTAEDALRASGGLIATLEAGKKIWPIHPQTEERIVKVLGCETMEDFLALHSKIAEVNRLRDKYFINSLHAYIETLEGPVAHDIAVHLRSQASLLSSSHFTPVQIQETLQLLGLTEVELYEKTGIALSTGQINACNEVAEFVEHFNYQPFAIYGDEHVRNACVGRRLRSEPSNSLGR